MKKTLFYSLLFIPIVFSSSSTSSVSVKNSVKSEVSGSGAKVETKIINKVNGVETSVSVDKPGEIEVTINNGKVDIKKSEGLVPTISIVTYSPTKEVLDSEDKDIRGGTGAVNEIMSSIQDFLSKFFGWFKRQS